VTQNKQAILTERLTMMVDTDGVWKGVSDMHSQT